MKPLISIIVPVYKVEEYLDECITSIINQTYENIEICLVDDGSPDGCPEKCDQWGLKDSRINVIHKKNGGLSDARNIGIDNANGKLIAFVDSDDYISEEYIETLYLAIEKSSANLVICNYMRVDNRGEKLSNDVNDNNQYILSGAQVIERRFVEVTAGYYIMGCNKLYRKNLFDNIRYPINRFHEDEYIFRALYEKCDKVVCLLKTMYYYRKRKGSIMDTALCDTKINDYLKCYEAEVNYSLNKDDQNIANMYMRVFCKDFKKNYQYINESRSKLKEIYDIYIDKINH